MTSTTKRTSRKPTTSQIIKISQWLSNKSQTDSPKTAETLATEAAQVLGGSCDISPRTIRRIASELNIKLRRNQTARGTIMGRPKVARLAAIAEAVIDLYKLAGADDKTVAEVQSKLLSN